MIAVSNVCCRSFGHLQRHRARLRLQLALVAPRPQVPSGLRPFVSPGVAEPIGLRLQHRVQRLLDRAPDDLVQMLLDPIVVDPDHVAQRRPFVILFHGGSLSSGFVDRLATPT